MTRRKKYKVTMEEDVHDAFDDFEHTNHLEFIVEADGEHHAIIVAEKDRRKYRSDNGFNATGSFSYHDFHAERLSD